MYHVCGDVKHSDGAGNRSPKLLGGGTPSPPKPVATEMSGAISNQRTVLQCYSCGKVGHRSFECKSAQSSTHKPMKPSPDKQNSSRLRLQILFLKRELITLGQSQITATSPSLTQWLGAKSIMDIGLSHDSAILN